MSAAITSIAPISSLRAFTRVLVALAALASFAAPARAEAPEETTARQHFAAGEYQKALDIYAQLYAKTLHPTYLRNIGRCHQNLGDPDRAISSFQEYLRKAKNLPEAKRAEIDGYIREMEQLKKDRERQNAAAQAAPQPAPPPPAAAPPPVEPQSVPMASTSDLSARSEPAETPVYAKWWFWTGVGAIVAAGVVTAVVLSSGSTSPSPIGGNASPSSVVVQ